MKETTEIKEVVKSGYKRTKLGWMPDTWEFTSIQSFGRIITGSTPSTNQEEYYNGSFLFVSPTDIESSKYIMSAIKTLTEAGFHQGRKIDKGSVLFVSIGSTIGKAGIAGCDMVTNQQINSIIPNEKNDNEFLYYQLCLNSSRIKRIAGHQAVPIINKSTFAKIEIFKAPLPEQRRIAAILSTWDKAIDTLQNLMAKKQERKKGLMQVLLTGELRLRSATGERFDGEWEEVRLGEVVIKTKGNIVKQNEEKRGLPIIDTTSFDGFPVMYTTEKDVRQCKEIDVLLLWDGSKAGKVMTGKLGVVGSTFAILSPISQVNNIFLCNQMKLNERKIMEVREGSGIPHVPKDFLKWYKVRLPQIPEQQKIASVLSTADREIENLQAQLEKLREQKKGLMQKLLTGEVRTKK